ncbi:MAG: tetratricopeptide repeat protein [Dyella sp.]
MSEIRPTAASTQDCIVSGKARELLAVGQTVAALQLLEQALSSRQASCDALLLLARLQLTCASPAQALATLDRYLPGYPEDGRPLLLRAQILLLQQHDDEACAAFRAAIDKLPNNPTAQLGLATASGRLGRASDARDAAMTAIELGDHSTASHYLLGRALFDLGDYPRAQQHLRSALELDPTHLDTHTALCELVWMSTGELSQASAALDETLRAHPQASTLRAMKAKLLATAGQPEQALHEAEQALACHPNDPQLRLTAINLALPVQPREALAHALTLMQIAPHWPQAQSAQLNACFASGDIEQAAVLAEQRLRQQPQDGHALAILAACWRAQGRTEYRQLYDYRHMIYASPLDVPSGWSTLDGYLADLRQALQQRHVNLSHPLEQTLRGGSQVALDFDQDSARVIRAFREAIDGPLRNYLGALGPGDDPLRRRQTGGYRISGAWSVSLRSQGHHLNHFHGHGWISSACYIALPADLANAPPQGWLTFGQPAWQPGQTLPAEYYLRPVPGLLVLFPSWMWHGTLPFDSPQDQRRLTVAFDVLPA